MSNSLASARLYPPYPPKLRRVVAPGLGCHISAVPPYSLGHGCVWPTTVGALGRLTDCGPIAQSLNAGEEAQEQEEGAA